MVCSGSRAAASISGSSARVGVARRGSIVARSRAAYAGLVSCASGTATKAGSPSLLLRSMKARWYALPSRWSQGALPKAGRVASCPRMLSASAIVTPPEEEGGIASSAYWRKRVRMGVRHTGA